MTKEQAIEQLEHSISGWEEFWSGACHYISEEDIEAIECLIKVTKGK
jgi:hypothetical protein